MQILEAEVRLQYALQYRIPYPRLEHTAQARGRPKPQQLFGVQPEAGRSVLCHSADRDVTYNKAAVPVILHQHLHKYISGSSSIVVSRNLTLRTLCRTPGGGKLAEAMQRRKQASV